jgi:hypothetical protein
MVRGERSSKRASLAADHVFESFADAAQLRHAKRSGR